MNFFGSIHDDHFDLPSSNDIAYGFDGDDAFVDNFSTSSDMMYGGVGNDRFTTRAGNDGMYGGPGNDEFWILNSTGNVTVRGGKGNGDMVVISRAIFAAGEVQYLDDYAKSGAVFDLIGEDGYLDIKGVELIMWVA